MIRIPLARRQPKPRPDDDPAYLAWIRREPCAVLSCFSSRSEAHHAGPHGDPALPAPPSRFAFAPR
jgi:hypothetical protein